MKNLVLRFSLSCLIIIITTMSYAGNYLPILTWPGTGTYKSDGLDPEVGVNGTTFTFRVKYIDYDNEGPPGYVMVYINTDEDVKEILMSPEGTSNNYRKGVIYRATSTLTSLSLSSSSSYSYYFKVIDSNGEYIKIKITDRSGADGATYIPNLQEAYQFPTTVKLGPKVASNSILDWLGSGNYESDGLHPEKGGTNTTFTYMVKCFGTLSTGYPILSIMNSSGTESTYRMKQLEGGTPLTGRVYVATHTFSSSSASGYKYSFIITDSATISGDGPDIYPNTGGSAFFDWTGELGYEDDGVEPDIASYGSTFTYKIKYVNVEGKQPDTGYPKITIDGTDYTMNFASGTSKTENIYWYQGIPSYANNISNAKITVSINGYQEERDINFWTANIPPILRWTKEKDYISDGVEPNIGTAGTVFTFRIKYTDPEGGSPQEVLLVIKDGTSTSRISMTPVSNEIYQCTGTFSLGEHEYYFSAPDSEDRSMPAAGSEGVVGKSDISSIPPQLATFTVSIGTLTSVTITGTDTIGIEGTASFTAQAVNDLNAEIGDNYVRYDDWKIIGGTGKIIAGKSSKTVTLQAGTSTGTITLQVTASSAHILLQGDEVIGTKTITIKPGKPQALFFSETGTNTISFSLPVGSSTSFSVSGRDGYGNVTPVDDCSWYVEGSIGTLNTLTGSKATFTAGTVVGTGAVVISTMGNGGTLTATVTITVMPGSFHHFDISMATLTVLVDGSMTITLSPKDINGNTFTTNDVPSPELKVTVGTGTASLGTCAINTSVEFPWPQSLRNNLGTGTVYALINGNKKGTSSPFQVVPGLPHHFKITSPATNTAVQAGGSITVIAQLQDRYNNPIDIGTSACVVFQSDSFGSFTSDATSSTSSGTITIQTNANGQIVGMYQPNFSSKSKARLVGIYLTSDNNVSGTSGAIILTIPAALDTIGIETPATFTAGIPATISVGVRDSYNNPATATLIFSSPLGTMTRTIAGNISNDFSWQQDSGTWTGTISFTQAQTQAILNITAQNGKTATAAFAILPAEPYSLQAIGATTYNGLSGDTWTLGVKLKDRYGNPIKEKNINWELVLNPSNAMISSIVSTTNQAGEASITLTLGTKTGTYSVKASPEGSSTISATFTAITSVGSPILSSGSYPLMATVANNVSLEVVFKDNFDNPFPNRDIRWQILQPSSGGMIVPLTSTTNASGIATTSLTLGTRTGLYMVTAMAGTLTATFTITALPDIASTISTSITPGTAVVVNNPVGLTIILSDRWGNPAATSTITWQPQWLTATTTQTINSTATLNLTLGTRTGVYIVTATSGRLTATFTITALPDIAATISTSITPGTVAVVNNPVGLSITLSDRWGNPAATSTVTWQPQGLTATTTQTINGSSSLAFTLGTRTGVYIVTARSGTLTATFTITAIAGTPIPLQNFIHGSQTVNSGVSLELSLRDEFGNPCPGTVTWSLIGTPAAASLSATSTPIDPQTGSATITLTIGTKTGDYCVRAQVNDYTATFTITAEPGAVGTMLTGYLPPAATVNTTLPLTIGLYDLYGNPAATSTVTWQAQGLLATTTQTINGTATFMFTLGTRTGEYVINASQDGRKATFTITATPGTPTISQNLINGVGTVGKDVNLEITCKDEFGNVIPGTTTWQLIQMPATASLSAGTTTINPQTGTSSVTLQLGTKTGDYQIRAQVNGYTATFTISAQSSDLVATDTSLGTATGTPIAGGTMTFTIILYDEYGNIIQNGGVDWAVTRGTITIATRTTYISNGRAEYSSKIGTIAGTYTISANFRAILLKLFSIYIAPSSPILSSNFSIFTATPNEDITLEVYLRDEFGNPCTGTVTWSLIGTPTAASLSATSTPIDPQTGSATITFMGTMSGKYVVKAAIDGKETTFTITVQVINNSNELRIYPNPIRVQEWNRSLPDAGDGPWVKFGIFNSNVTIRIYDISGNLIRIIEDVIPSSDGFVKWDMKNKGSIPGESGVEVNAGVYLCIATCNGQKRIGRFAVIK